jgi:GTPase
MLTDEVKIKVLAGKGGDGAVAFDKIKMALGPTGGRGGNGGSVYFEGVSDLLAMRRYRNKKEHWAEKGKRGGNDRSDGKAGEDLVLPMPIGSVIKNVETGQEFEIKKVGQKILAAKGGVGGRGNFFFRSSVNTTPKEVEKGRSGEEFEFEIELRLIAQVGLIGLPSAGKSSLLNELTKAEAKVAAYHFTTLEPNLGVMENGMILADIPGLIEGASAGKGLGIKFLRHIKRTEILAHCISLESDDVLKDYNVVRGELEKYDPELLKKKEIILLTKMDLIDDGKVKQNQLKKIDKEVIAVSIYDQDSLEELKKRLAFLKTDNLV